MHIAKRHRDEPRSHPCPAEVDGVGIGVRRAARDLDDERNALRFRRVVEKLENVRVDRRAARKRRASPEHDLALVVGIPAANVGRARDVDRDGDVRLGRERHGARPRVVADLLLHGRCGDHVARRAAALRNPPGGLERDVTAHSVVEGAGCDPVAVQVERRAVPDHMVPGPDEGAQLVAILCADVEEEVVRLDGLEVLAPLALLALCGDDAGNGPSACLDVDALADHDSRVPATQRAHRSEPVVAEIRDDYADLVDMADEEERRASGCGRHAHP